MVSCVLYPPGCLAFEIEVTSPSSYWSELPKPYLILYYTQAIRFNATHTHAFIYNRKVKLHFCISLTLNNNNNKKRNKNKKQSILAKEPLDIFIAFFLFCFVLF